MENYIIIYCTVPSDEVGNMIAEEMVSSRLAACVNMIPRISSIYRWQEKVCHDLENLLIIKSKKSLFDKISLKISEIHPYDVPEIISVDITGGSEPYLAWLAGNTMPL